MMESGEIMERAVEAVRKTDPKSAEAMEGRIVADSLARVLNGTLKKPDGKKVRVIDEMTSKVVEAVLMNPTAKDLKILSEIVDASAKSEKEGGSARVNATDRRLAQLAGGKPE